MAARVRNKAAAPVQITAEALLRDAISQTEPKAKKVESRFRDKDEWDEHSGRQRAEFEKYVRINPDRKQNWLRYAQFELDQSQWARMRSVMERAMAAASHSRDPSMWLAYCDMEIKGRNINMARNLLNRAVTILPRVDKLWLKYIYVMETLGDISGTRAVFARWLQWEPDAGAWTAAIKFEIRYSEIDNARSIFENMAVVHPEPNTWLKWAKFEQEYGTSDLCREVFTQAIEMLGEDFMSEKVFDAFARFEVRLKEYERARSIYKYALDRMPRSKSVNLHKAYTTFEKQFGDSEGVEDVVLEKRRVQYEEEVRANPKNYDAWLDLARLEETGGDWSKAADVYERAVAQIPPGLEKRHWRRYLYLWLFYASGEELQSGDMERVAQIYQACIKLIPHARWTSAKIWINYAQHYLRQGRLTESRKVFGQSIGKCPKNKLFKEYILQETQLYEFDRVRQLYNKWVSWDPTNSEAWKGFAELERGLADTERARAIYELAIQQDELDMPELIWKEFIDFEVENEEYERARALYEQLLQRTSHVKVWTSYAHFEASVPEAEDEAAGADEDKLSDAAKTRVRAVFERAYKAMKEADLKEERVQLLRAWLSFEEAQGSEEDIEKVRKQMPSKVKKRRRLDDDTFEEYMDWIFPADDEGEAKLSNLLAMAQKWKKAKEAGEVA